jgi:hypothetical protein
MNLALASSTRDNVKLKMPGSLGVKTLLDEGNRVGEGVGRKSHPFSAFRVK